MLTYTYKAVGECTIQADVYGPVGQNSGEAIVWIHGGALIIGNRAGIDPEQLDRYLKALLSGC